MSQPLFRARLALGLALALVGLGVATFALLGKSTLEPPAPARPSEPEQRAVDPTKPATVESESDPTPAKPPTSKPKLDREASDRVRAQVQRSLEQRSGSPAPRSADPASPRDDEPPAGEPPLLDREYIRERIKEDLLPVAIECYESALADDPELAGTLVMHFAILGEPDVGGVVDEAVVDDQSTLTNEFVRECMRESLMAVSFEAPPEGGRIEVTYPFAFEPGEDE